jgi:anti-sigma B factor antagonist
MELEVSVHKNILLFTPTGSFDFHTIRVFEERFQSESRNYKNFALNMKDVTFIDSSGMGALVKVLSYAKQRKGVLYLFNLSNDLERLLDKADLLTFFQTVTEKEFDKKFPPVTESSE